MRTGMNKFWARMAIPPALLVLMLPEPGYAHDHGVARVEAVLDASVLTVRLDSPLDNLAGFEHVPKSERDKQAIRTMATHLRTVESMLRPGKEGQCVAQSSDLVSAQLDPVLLGNAAVPDGARKANGKHKQEHSDIVVTWTFKCATPEALREISFGLFEHFPRLQRINAAVVAGHKQSAGRLSKKSTALKW